MCKNVATLQVNGLDFPIERQTDCFFKTSTESNEETFYMIGRLDKGQEEGKQGTGWGGSLCSTFGDLKSCHYFVGTVFQ